MLKEDCTGGKEPHMCIREFGLQRKGEIIWGKEIQNQHSGKMIAMYRKLVGNEYS